MKRRDMETTVGRPADVCEQDGECPATKLSERWSDALSEMSRGPDLIDELRDHAKQGRYVLIEPNGALTAGTREYVVRHLGGDAATTKHMRRVPAVVAIDASGQAYVNGFSAKLSEEEARLSSPDWDGMREWVLDLIHDTEPEEPIAIYQVWIEVEQPRKWSGEATATVASREDYAGGDA